MITNGLITLQAAAKSSKGAFYLNWDGGRRNVLTIAEDRSSVIYAVGLSKGVQNIIDTHASRCKVEGPYGAISLATHENADIPTIVAKLVSDDHQSQIYALSRFDENVIIEMIEQSFADKGLLDLKAASGFGPDVGACTMIRGFIADIKTKL